MGFIGLPTPANALFWGGLTAMPYALLNWQPMPWCLLAISLLSGFLMVSDIPFFSLKMHGASWKDYRIQYLFLIGCAVLIAVCVVEAVRYQRLEFVCFAGTACIVWYVSMNILSLIISRKQ